MAKISARGDSERLRWRGPRGTLVLTEQGRLLFKSTVDTTYRVQAPRGDAKRWTPQTAGAQAAVLGFELTATGGRRRL